MRVTNFIMLAACLASMAVGLPRVMAEPGLSSSRAAEQQLHAKTRWLGNTWGGVYDGVPSKEVNDQTRSRRGAFQMRVQALGVGRGMGGGGSGGNGWLFVNGDWDESHKAMGIYVGDDAGRVKDLGGYYFKRPNSDDWSDDQWSNDADGGAVAVSDKYVFITVKDKRGPGRLRRLARDRGYLPTLPDVKVSDEKIRGLAVGGRGGAGDELFVSDQAGDRIKVYDFKLHLKRQFAFAHPGRLTVDGRGNLWVLEADATPRLCEVSPQGRRTGAAITFAANAQPVGVAFNRVTGELVVADDGADRNIKMYDPARLHGSPTQPAEVLGARGGLWSTAFGTKRGQWAPGKFYSLTSVAADARGNVYIGMWEKKIGAAVESYTARGRFRYVLRNQGWIETAVADPNDLTQVYTSTNRYRINVDAGMSSDGNRFQGWTYVATTRDLARYPDDPRQDAKASPLAIRHLHGQKYLYVTNMYAQWLGILKFRQSGQTDILKPVALIGGGRGRSPEGYPNERSRAGDYIWTDQNGDGSFDAEEFAYDAGDVPDDAWGWEVQANGDVWLASKTKGVYRYRLQGVNDAGAPRYSFAARDRVPMPRPFSQLRRVTFDPDHDRVYLAGYTPQYPNRRRTDGKEVWGKSLGRVIAAYAWNGNGTIPNRPVWTVKNLTFFSSQQKHRDMRISGMDLAGNYLFVQQDGARIDKKTLKPRRDTQYTDIYNAKSGKRIGYLKPGTHASAGLAQIDLTFGMRAYQRANGSYLVFLEDDWFGKVLMYEWTPGKSHPPIGGS